MKYGIIGTGAIGGYYGGKLANDGQEVHFLMHRDYEYVKQHGLQVDSCDGSFHLDHVHAYAKTSEMPPCDVVLVCLKSMLISIGSPVTADSTETGSTFMITQLSITIPSLTLSTGLSLLPHQLLLARRVPFV